MRLIKRTRRIWLGVLLFSALFASNACSPDGPEKAQDQAQPAPPEPRVVFVLLDRTGSYSFCVESIQRIVDIISSLGPGDRFYLIEVGPEFRPETNLKIQLHMPGVPADILTAASLSERERKQDALDALWQEVARHQRDITDYLHDSKREVSGQTDVFGALGYCSARLAREEHGDRLVFIFSDLIHDVRGVTTADPPSYPLSFSGARINVLFMPRVNKPEWEAKETAWRTWALQKAQAASFAMLDAAESHIAALLEPSPVLRSLPSSFSEE